MPNKLKKSERRKYVIKLTENRRWGRLMQVNIDVTGAEVNLETTTSSQQAKPRKNIPFLCAHTSTKNNF